MTQQECDALAAAIADYDAQIVILEDDLTQLRAERGAKQGAYNAGCPPQSPPPPPGP